MDPPLRTENYMPTKSTDRIEKQVILEAPRARVWRALTDVSQFNAWFGVMPEITPALRQAIAATF